MRFIPFSWLQFGSIFFSFSALLFGLFGRFFSYSLCVFDAQSIASTVYIRPTGSSVNRLYESVKMKTHKNTRLLRSLQYLYVYNTWSQPPNFNLRFTASHYNNTPPHNEINQVQSIIILIGKSMVSSSSLIQVNGYVVRSVWCMIASHSANGQSPIYRRLLSRAEQKQLMILDLHTNTHTHTITMQAKILCNFSHYLIARAIYFTEKALCASLSSIFIPLPKAFAALPSLYKFTKWISVKH